MLTTSSVFIDDTPKTKNNTSKELYIALGKYDMVKQMGLEDGTACTTGGCLEASICPGCGRRFGVNVEPTEENIKG